MTGHDPRAVAGRFDIAGEFVRGQRYGGGHINDTYLAVYRHRERERRFVHQRINENVFTDPPALMRNVELVLSHVHARLAAEHAVEIPRRALTLVPARDGRSFVEETGSFWRTYLFVDGARSHSIASSPRQACEAARAFGSFQRLLADYTGPRLGETIPRFHHTPSRLAAFHRALDRDEKNRAAGARREIDLVLSREPLAGALLDLAAREGIPERITHNDTKLDNVLIDDVTGEGICVIDLDTVMPGLSLYDFGDLVRTATSPVAEDEPRHELVEVRVPMFAAIAHGYLSALGHVLLPAERENLVLAGKLITFEVALRFLADHLEGDRYFKIHRPHHNLERARTQLALVASLEEREEELSRLVEDLAEGEGGEPLEGAESA